VITIAGTSTKVNADSAVSALLYVTGDRHLVVGAKSGALSVYDIATGALIETFSEAHDKHITSLTLSPDAVSCCFNNFIDFIFVQKGFASASHDKTVRLWNFELKTFDDGEGGNSKRLTLVHTRTLQLSEDALCVKYSADGKYIVVALLDNTARAFFEDTFNVRIFLYILSHNFAVLPFLLRSLAARSMFGRLL
jgi:U3 small nucleolar RNA-associated protein 12